MAFLLAAAVTRAGTFLIAADTPAHADAAFVFAGDATCGRILRASELVAAGWTKRIFVSGPDRVYGVNEADLAIDCAVRSGRPREWFLPLYTDASSTREEVAAALPQLRAAGVRSLLAVTSDYHTRRAGTLLRQAAGDGISVRMIATPERRFVPDRWWQTRDSAEVLFYEWVKTVVTALGG